jgi:hypothetical protein
MCVVLWLCCCCPGGAGGLFNRCVRARCWHFFAGWHAGAPAVAMAWMRTAAHACIPSTVSSVTLGRLTNGCQTAAGLKCCVVNCGRRVAEHNSLGASTWNAVALCIQLHSWEVWRCRLQLTVAVFSLAGWRLGAIDACCSLLAVVLTPTATAQSSMHGGQSSSHVMLQVVLRGCGGMCTAACTSFDLGSL